jgi:hypothetical protein
MQPVEDLVELGQECPGGAHLFVGVAVEHGCCFANRWGGGVALAVGGTVGVSGRVRRLGADLVDVPLCNAYCTDAHHLDSAVAALRAWLRHRLLDDGALFCPINRGGRVTLRQLTTQAIYERFQLRARRQACPRG